MNMVLTAFVNLFVLHLSFPLYSVLQLSYSSSHFWWLCFWWLCFLQIPCV